MNISLKRKGIIKLKIKNSIKTFEIVLYVDCIKRYCSLKRLLFISLLKIE